MERSNSETETGGRIDLAGKRVLVLGLGMSGRSAAEFCAARGAHVLVADERPATAFDDIDSLGAQIAGDIRVQLGAPLPDMADFDLVVPSPGIPRERYATARLALGDIELAGRTIAVPVAAVTGTNGKSTTVGLLEAMLVDAGLRARAAGNVGVPALSLVGAPIDVAVLEVSSFQLEAVQSFRPRVAAVLNLTMDHLDRHGNATSYAEAKRRLIEQQGEGDVAVLNFDDPVVRAFAEHTSAEVVFISAFGPPEAPGSRRSAWLDAGAAVLRDGDTITRFELDGRRLAGRHNLENILAALTMAWCLGADPARAVVALTRVVGLPHRCEVVLQEQAVTWVDDSKATNVGAALKSLESFSSPILWIAGGRDKQSDYGPLVGAAAAHVRCALLIGEAASKIADVLDPHVPSETVETMERAVSRARELAKPGDVVLLAPACASFDQFTNFEARGKAFAACVRAPESSAPNATPDGDSA